MINTNKILRYIQLKLERQIRLEWRQKLFSGEGKFFYRNVHLTESKWRFGCAPTTIRHLCLRLVLF